MSFILLLILWPGFPVTAASERVVIPFGLAPSLDGKASEEEWSDAAGIQLSIESKVTVQVRLKHDDRNLYLAFHFRDTRDRALVFPELLIDTHHDRSEQWGSDDWWFHVSGTDCEALGRFSDYSNCRADHPDWNGIPNYELSEDPPPVEQMEISIALKKLGIRAEEPFGFSVTVELVPDERAFWPREAALESPSTWGTAVLGAK